MHSRSKAAEIAEHIVGERYERPSLVSKIACEIAAEIVEDIRRPGQDLNSVELARQYRTSRTPIREALMLLEKEGLVEILPRRRPRVASPSIREVREIYRVRATLLEMIAADIALNASEEAIATLRPILTAMEAAANASDVGSFFWANVDFHRRNAEIAENRTVKKIIDSLLLRTLPLRRLGLRQPGRMKQSHDDHQRLGRAYEDRDAILAAALIRSNHISGLAVLERLFAAADRSCDPSMSSERAVSTKLTMDAAPGPIARNGRRDP